MILSIILIILALLLAILLWILLAPIVLLIDTDRSHYSISLRTIASARFVYDDMKVIVYAQILFIKKKFVIPDDFLDKPDKPKKEKKKKTKKEKKSKKKRKINFRKAIRLVQKYLKGIIDTFDLRALRVNFDTRDFPTNGILIPVFSTLNHKSDNIKIYVNFEKKYSFYLDLRNRSWNFLVLGVKGFFDYLKVKK
jgi:hypothetical protein